MSNYIVKRLFLAAITTVAISILSFVIISLPEGDYVDRYIEELEMDGTSLSMAEAQNLREYYGLDEPIVIQYWKWASKIVQLEFGQSFAQHRPIKELIAERLITTIALTGFTVILTWVFALPVGIYTAVRHNSIGDYTFTFIGFTGLAVPDFLLGLVLMYIAFAYFDQSVGGLFSPQYLNAPWSFARIYDLFKHLWIPAIVIGTAGTAGLIRIMRNNLLDELGKPYVVTARSKGMTGWKVIIKYPVRVALNPFISGVGYLLPNLVGGSVIVSVVLSLPTMGPLLLNAILQQDMHLAGLIILLLGFLTVIGTLISDLLLVVADPRIRLEN